MLDVFAGRLHPVTTAAVRRGFDCFEPFDLDHNQAHDILDNAVFEALLKLCWSGIIALIMLAPPCKEYFRLKLRPGGPKALRTPQHMNGVPGLSPSQLKRLQDSQAIHHMLREHQCSLVWVDACQHGKTFAKSWAFGCNSPRIQALAARCSHTYKHTSIAGVVDHGVFLSTLTAEYPETLACQLAAVGAGRVSKTGGVKRALHLRSTFPAQPSLAPCRLPVCDGAGMHSTADWYCPNPDHPLQAVAAPWLRWLHERGVVPRIVAHVSQGNSDSPLTEQECTEAVRHCLRSPPNPNSFRFESLQRTALPSAPAAPTRGVMGGPRPGSAAFSARRRTYRRFRPYAVGKSCKAF